MNRTTIMIFSFIAGAILADVTHPAGQRLWSAEAATDSEVGCTEDCLEPSTTPTMECLPSKDKSYLKCWVKEQEVTVHAHN